MSFPSAAKLSLSEMEIGRTHSFEARITAADIDRFAALSGDYSPLHMDERFAVSRGFPGRVVHGAYLAGLASQMVGMHLPGENCLLNSLQMKFISPICADSAIRISGTIDQISEATKAAVISIIVTAIDTGGRCATGKAVLSLTN